MDGHRDGTAGSHVAAGQYAQYPQYPQQGFPQVPQQQAHGWPQEGYVAPPAAPAVGNTLSVVAIVLGAIALIVLPPVFGIAGIACAAVAMKKGERLAKVGLGVSIAGLVLGMAIGLLVFASLT